MWIKRRMSLWVTNHINYFTVCWWLITVHLLFSSHPDGKVRKCVVSLSLSDKTTCQNGSSNGGIGQQSWRCSKEMKSDDAESKIKIKCGWSHSRIAGWWSKCWHHQSSETTAMELEELNTGELININENKSGRNKDTKGVPEEMTPANQIPH